MKLALTIETDRRIDLSGYPYQVRVTDHRAEMVELFDSQRGEPTAHVISGIVERFIEQLPSYLAEQQAQGQGSALPASVLSSG